MLNIIRTALDTEPSSVFIPQMTKFKKNNPDKGIILIVPDSLSHTGERLMAQTFGGSGINGNETLTFHQMIRRFLPNSSLRLTDTGKRMLLYRAASSAQITDGNFAALVKKPGFLDCLSELISEFKCYGVSPSQLFDNAEKSDNPLLKSKLKVVSSVFEKYNALFDSEGFSDSDTDLELIAQIILDNGFFTDKAVWIAGFDELLPLNLKVVSAIVRTCENVTVTIPEDTNGSSELFHHCEASVNSLINICKEYGISFEYTSNLLHCEKSRELEFLIDNYEDGENSYGTLAENIHIMENPDIYSEVDNAAIKIADLTLEYGYHYGDIGVVVSEPEIYLPFVEAVFSEYKIPYFSDHAISVSEHPVSMILTASADLIKENRSTASVMRFLRTGLFNNVSIDDVTLTEDDIDKIENHAIKLGIRGDMWEDSKFWINFDKGIFDNIIKDSSPSEHEILDIWYKITPLMKRIKTFCKKVSKKAPVSELCKYLFEFFDELKLYEAISKISAELMLVNPNESMRFQQVWNLITELAEQAVAVLGKEILSFNELYQYIKNGLTKSKMDIIPAGIDRVTVGGTTSFSPDKIKILFILGTNSGKLPALSSADGLLSENDRKTMHELGTELSLYGIQRNWFDEFRLLKLLSEPTEHLYVSYALSDSAGNKLLPSIIITTLKKLFPTINIEKPSSGNHLLISTPEVTIKKLLLYHEESDPVRQKVYNWYNAHSAQWQKKLALIDSVNSFNSYTPSVTPENAAALYKKYTSYSVSRLENFYVCPFRYFLENGLKAKEREERKVQKSDLGNLLHWAVQKYCTTVDNNGTPEEKHENWINLSEEKSKAIIEDIFAEAKNSLSSNDTSKRTDNILNKVHALFLRCVPIINMSFKNSKYIACGYEWNFENLIISDGKDSVKLHGIIDRLDIYENKDTDTAYIRVIDYKSGSKQFSASGIYNKLDLQLGVYAIAAQDAYQKGLVGEASMSSLVNGIFYEKLNDRFEKSTFDSIESSDKPSDDVLDGMSFIPSGMEKGKEVYYADGLKDIDIELNKTGKSHYLKIELNKAKSAVNKNYSAVTSETNMAILQKWIKKAVISADKSIKSGKIDILPYKKSAQDTGCKKYCPYKDICTFDRSKNESYRNLASGRMDAFAKMEMDMDKQL